MISLIQEQRIACLLAQQGTTLRSIAAVAGVSHDTVWRRRHGYVSRVLISHEIDAATSSKTPRCKRCGAALTEVPCRACQVRRQLHLNF